MNKQPGTRKKSTAKANETATWPFIRWIDSRQRWMVDTRTKHGGSREFYRTKAEAEGAAQTARVRRANEGGAGFDETRLASYGWTVARAIQFALEHLERTNATVPVSEAVKAILDFKRGRVGETRLSDTRNRLARFVARFDGRTIGSITPEDICGFLDTIPHPATRNDYRKEIVMLWGFARSKRWIAEPLDNRLVPVAQEPDKARTILTVEQARALMAASEAEDIRALNALILFGGCRREEVEKLDWRNINFRTGHIEISAEVSKVARERFAPMPENLREWLLPIAKASGPIVSRNLMRPLREVWKRAEIYPWPQDAHRHSFISYRRQIIGDAQTALDAGTSEGIIKRHYKRPVTEDDAREYFAIVPVEPAAIIPLFA